MPNKVTFSDLNRLTQPVRLIAGGNPDHLIVTGMLADRFALLERRLLSWAGAYDADPSEIGGAS